MRDDLDQLDRLRAEHTAIIFDFWASDEDDVVADDDLEDDDDEDVDDEDEDLDDDDDDDEDEDADKDEE